MSFKVANASHPLASRTFGVKLYALRATLANGADPTIVAGEGIKIARAGEGSYTLTFDESVADASGSQPAGKVLWWDVKLAGQTDLQYCSATLGDEGDADDGITMTVSTGTVDASNARTPDDIDGGTLLVLVAAQGPGVQFSGQG